jgi:periplasmic divalent cation tolerance protein
VKVLKVMKESRLVIAVTTFAEKQHASEMAARVIEAGAAACAQIDGPIESHYRWEGTVCQDTEWRLTIKTTSVKAGELSELVHANHPYDQPQWIVIAVEQASDGYGNWVRDRVAHSGPLPK